MRKEILVMAVLSAMPFAAQAGGDRLHLPADAFGPAPLVVIAPGGPESRGNVARVTEALLTAGLAVLEAGEDGLGAARHPMVDDGRVGLLGFGPDAAGWDGRFSFRLRLTLSCGGPIEPVLAAVLRPGAPLPELRPACDEAARSWQSTGARAEAAPAGPLAAARLSVEPWPGSVRMSAGELADFLARFLAGTGS